MILKIAEKKQEKNLNKIILFIILLSTLREKINAPTRRKK